MANIQQAYKISAPIEKVWQCLVDPKIISQWSGAVAKIRPVVGFEFELWDGEVTGVNLAVEAPTRLVQEWQYGDWPKPSQVTFELEAINNHTEVKLTQTGHPKTEEKDLEEGWDSFYLGAIKRYLEKG